MLLRTHPLSKATSFTGVTRYLKHAMATANTVQLSASVEPVFYRSSLSDDLATTASELLQANHEKHHIFFNNDGFHNHIAHQVLSLYALNASKEDLQKAYDANASYQRKTAPAKASIVDELDDPAKFVTYLVPMKYYNDFLQFFTNKIEQQGWQETLQQYVFAGDELSNKMLVRMYAGFLRKHPNRLPASLTQHDLTSCRSSHSSWIRH